MQRITRLAVIGLVAAVVMSATYLVGFASGWSLRPALVPAAASSLSEGGAICGGTEAPKEFALFWEAWKAVQEDFHGEVPSAITLTYGAIGGMLNSLQDPYTYLVPPVEAKEEKEESERREASDRH